MPKLSLSDLRALLTAERADALSSMQANRLEADREKAMNYYLGDVKADLPSQPGRSSAVSRDVSDTVEGLMPSLMEIFTDGDEVVRFEPVGKDDVEAAEQETDYINHVFMQKNPGFLVLYSFIKDALISKVGIVKVWWEKKECEETEVYSDITDDQFMMLLMQPGIRVVEHTVKDQPGDGNAGAQSAY